MRIGLIIDTFNIGGAETMVFETAKLLSRHGDTPVVLHFGSDYVSEFAASNNIESHIIPNRSYYKKTVLLPLFALSTKRFIKGLRLDCLHSHLFGPIVAFAPLAWLLRLPHIGTLHDIYMIEEAPKRIWLLKLAALFRTQLIAVSRPMQAFYQQAGKFKNTTVAYIPNFSPQNNHLQQRAATREALGVNEHDIVIISVGRLVRLKRFDILIDAMADLKQCNTIKAYIIGDGPERNSLQAQLDKHDINDLVELLGERSDVPTLLAAADIFTLTSETDGMSKSILEALAAGLPVIATDVGGNKDLVYHTRNGYLLSDHSPTTLSGYIKQLANDRELMTAMGNSSRQLLEQEYNTELFLQRHIDIYYSLVKSH